MRLYHLLSSDHALNSIALKRMKVSTFYDLNDPFELLAASAGDKDLRKALRLWKADIQKRFGMICFSRNWENPVLWSHYASKHRGVCLGFEVADDLVSEVDYINKRIPIEFDSQDPNNGLDEGFVNKLLRTKFEHWQYEDERRLFIGLDRKTVEGGMYFKPFSEKMALREVILGPLCEVPIDLVRSLVDSTYDSVTVLKSRLAFKYFKVVVDERSVQSK
jgi:hypothetical protein